MLRMYAKPKTLMILIASIVLPVHQTAAENSDFSPYVNASGAISFPGDFRINMTHLGSWYVPEGEASGFHDVYTESESVLHYRKHGEFPDGATVVKELRHAKSDDYTTGSNVSHATAEIKQWFVMIKDTKGRFRDNAIWGDGWGWALFQTVDKNKNIAKNYTKDCLDCHVPAKETDWIYVEGYPTLTSPE
jgi:Cytochrome P460